MSMAAALGWVSQRLTPVKASALPVVCRLCKRRHRPRFNCCGLSNSITTGCAQRVMRMALTSSVISTFAARHFPWTSYLMVTPKVVLLDRRMLAGDEGDIPAPGMVDSTRGRLASRRKRRYAVFQTRDSLRNNSAASRLAKATAESFLVRVAQARSSKTRGQCPRFTGLASCLARRIFVPIAPRSVSTELLRYQDWFSLIVKFQKVWQGVCYSW